MENSNQYALPSQQKSPTKLLLIEGNTPTIQHYAAQLAVLDYSLDAVADCKSALARLHRGHEYSTVIIDIDLPDLMIGELMRFLQLRHQQNPIRVIALTTNFITLAMIMACAQIGIITIIRKPISVEYFVALLEEAEEAHVLELDAA